MTSPLRSLWARARAAVLPHHRYVANGRLVVCHSDGGSYLVCRIADPLMHDANHLASLLADALNANPETRG
jgi:hypothetical protein